MLLPFELYISTDDGSLGQKGNIVEVLEGVLEGSGIRRGKAYQGIYTFNRELALPQIPLVFYGVAYYKISD
uniref:Uncharacterized protein n=1 Tax=viral metagenome TaxID=1070528 RepID=A0A6H1ZUR1_9ZZZZ